MGVSRGARALVRRAAGRRPVPAAGMGTTRVGGEWLCRDGSPSFPHSSTSPLEPSRALPHPYVVHWTPREQASPRSSASLHEHYTRGRSVVAQRWLPHTPVRVSSLAPSLASRVPHPHTFPLHQWCYRYERRFPSLFEALVTPSIRPARTLLEGQAIGPAAIHAPSCTHPDNRRRAVPRVASALHPHRSHSLTVSVSTTYVGCSGRRQCQQGGLRQRPLSSEPGCGCRPARVASPQLVGY